MKLWELDSILQGDRVLPAAVASTNNCWRHLECLFIEMNALRTEGNAILYSELPAEFVEAVLNKVELFCYLSRDGWLRSRRYDAADEPMLFVDCFKKYGGSVLEEVGEKGSVCVG